MLEATPRTSIRGLGYVPIVLQCRKTWTTFGKLPSIHPSIGLSVVVVAQLLYLQIVMVVLSYLLCLVLLLSLLLSMALHSWLTDWAILATFGWRMLAISSALSVVGGFKRFLCLWLTTLYNIFFIGRCFTTFWFFAFLLPCHCCWWSLWSFSFMNWLLSSDYGFTLEMGVSKCCMYDHKLVIDHDFQWSLNGNHFEVNQNNGPTCCPAHMDTNGIFTFKVRPIWLVSELLICRKNL